MPKKQDHGKLRTTMEKKVGVFWAFLFLIILLSSQDYLYIHWDNTPSYLGFPIWIWWFACIHIVFILALYCFAKKHWRE